MKLDVRQITALQDAESLMFHSDFCPYLELKKLLSEKSASAHGRFRTLFTTFYGLNVGGLTEEFKDRYFEILFAGDFLRNGQPDFASILNELSDIPRRTGDRAMPFSFVSKLVAIHHEESPIYDRHVLAFFKSKAPAASEKKADRIQWFVQFLKQVRTDYGAWARDARISPVLETLKARDPLLAACHNVRLVDFLVWKAGNQKLL